VSKPKIDPKQKALAKIAGLNFADVTTFFAGKAGERDKKIAAMVKTRDEDFENDFPIVSEGDDNGAYVLGWRWVSFCGIAGFDKFPEDHGV
jgi:hypothetical protein